MFERCKHDWEIVVKETLPSAYEQAKQLGGKRILVPIWFFRKIVIIILRCKKCGKLHTKVIENP